MQAHSGCLPAGIGAGLQACLRWDYLCSTGAGTVRYLFRGFGKVRTRRQALCPCAIYLSERSWWSACKGSPFAGWTHLMLHWEVPGLPSQAQPWDHFCPSQVQKQSRHCGYPSQGKTQRPQHGEATTMLLSLSDQHTLVVATRMPAQAKVLLEQTCRGQEKVELTLEPLFGQSRGILSL